MTSELTPAHFLAIRRRRTIVIWLALLAWLTLLFFAVVTTRVPIEEDLRAKSSAALAAQGINLRVVTFEGRDATLGGTVSSQTDLESAVAIVRAVPGVRVVHSQLSVSPESQNGDSPITPTPGPTTTRPVEDLDPPSFVLLVSGGTAALTGTMPDEAVRDALVAGAIEAFGLGNVVNRMSVSSEVGHTSWLGNLAFLLAEMGDVTELSMVVAGGTVELSGLAVSQAASDSIESLVAASLPGLRVVNELDVGSDEREVVQRQIDGLDLASISFEIGSARLSAGSSDILDGLVGILAAHPDINVEVGGHTDATGSEESNVELSQRRAETVVAYLVSEGISQTRLTAVGYGSSDPVADNFTEEGRALNRRIEIVVLGDR